MLDPASARYEIKLCFDPLHLPQVESWVRLHPAHWRVTYPPRQVNNVYFDTAGYRNLNDNLSGVGERCKLRLRWYGPHLAAVAGAQLELKSRQGAVGLKDVRPLDLACDLSGQSWPVLLPALQEAAGERGRLWLAQFPYPVLINCYRRAYYATPDAAVRLTVDTELRAYDQRFSAWPNLHCPAPTAARAVLELKAPAADVHARRLSEVLARFPLGVDRHSKYVHGMLAAPDFDGVEL